MAKGLLLVGLAVMAVGMFHFASNSALAAAGEACTMPDGSAGMRKADGTCMVGDGTITGPVTIASDYSGGLVKCGKSGGSACTLCDLVVGFQTLTGYLTSILIVITLAGLFLSGVMYIISAGDESMMTSAKNFAKASVIGFTVVLGAWLIVNVTMMWVMSAKTDLGLGSDKNAGWSVFKFKCTK